MFLYIDHSNNWFDYNTFITGIKIVKNKTQATIMSSDQVINELQLASDGRHLEQSLRLLWDHFKICLNECTEREKCLEELAERSAKNWFPITIGCRPTAAFWNKTANAPVNVPENKENEPPVPTNFIKRAPSEPSSMVSFSLQLQYNEACLILRIFSVIYICVSFCRLAEHQKWHRQAQEVPSSIKLRFQERLLHFICLMDWSQFNFWIIQSWMYNQCRQESNHNSHLPISVEAQWIIELTWTCTILKKYWKSWKYFVKPTVNFNFTKHNWLYCFKDTIICRLDYMYVRLDRWPVVVLWKSEYWVYFNL